MAMSASQMAQNIASNMNALGINQSSPEQLNILTAMCEGIIQEIINGAETETQVTGGSSAGTYTGDVTG